MKRKPEISVIVLTYNQAQTIARTLDSILAQQCNFPYEIVVSDDSPDDSTRRVIEQYAKAFPSVVRLLPKHENFGVVRNYFYALSQCKGDLIADCAGDDYWYGFGSLQKKRDIMVANPDAALVHSDWLRVDINDYNSNLIPSDPSGGLMKYRRDYADGRELLPMVLAADSEPLIHISTALYRRDIITQALKLNPSMIENPEWQCEDLPVTAALLASGRGVRWIPDTTLVYSIGGNTISSPARLSRSALFYAQAAVMTLNLARHYGIPSRIVAKSINAKMRFAMNQAIASGDKSVIDNLRSIIVENNIRRPIVDRLKEAIKLLINKRNLNC